MIHKPEDFTHFSGVQSPNVSRHYQLHLEAERRGLTRRQFLKFGVLAAGSAGISMLASPALADYPGKKLPEQLPYFSPVLKGITGLDIPFFLPPEVDPFSDPAGNSDPTSIRNFRGHTGLIEAEGVGDPAHNSDGLPRAWACDVRFMKGVYVDRSGKQRHGAFGFF